MGRQTTEETACGCNSSISMMIASIVWPWNEHFGKIDFQNNYNGNSTVVSISFFCVGVILCMNEDNSKCSHRMDFDLQHLGLLER